MFPCRVDASGLEAVTELTLRNRRAAIEGDSQPKNEKAGRVLKKIFRGVETTKGHLERPPVYRKADKMALSQLKIQQYQTNGGAEGDRTPGLRIANASLSQLSYSPFLAIVGDRRCLGPRSRAETSL